MKSEYTDAYHDDYTYVQSNYIPIVILATANHCLIRFSNIMESFIKVHCLKLSSTHRSSKTKMAVPI